MSIRPGGGAGPAGAYVPLTRTVAGHALNADVTLVKGDVGLGNVDNTADTAKPVSTAQATADTAVQAAAAADVTSRALLKASNLSDVASAATARTNLGVSPARAVVSKTAAYTAVDGDIVLASATTAAFAVTLPAVASGLRVTVKKTDSSANAVTITPGSGTIDGAATVAISTRYQAYEVASDGTNWFVV